MNCSQSWLALGVVDKRVEKAGSQFHPLAQDLCHTEYITAYLYNTFLESSLSLSCLALTSCSGRQRIQKRFDYLMKKTPSKAYNEKPY